MLDLPELTSIIRSADRRSHSFEAMRQLMLRFPDRAHGELSYLLHDPTASDRSKSIVLYYLQDHELFNDLSEVFAPQHQQLIDSIFRDVELLEEQGLDAFSTEDFPNG